MTNGECGMENRSMKYEIGSMKNDSLFVFSYFVHPASYFKVSVMISVADSHEVCS